MEHVNAIQMDHLATIVKNYRDGNRYDLPEELARVLMDITEEMTLFVDILTQTPDISVTASRLTSYSLLIKQLQTPDLYLDVGSLPASKRHIKTALIHAMILSFNDPEQLRSLEFAYKNLSRFQEGIYENLKLVHVSSGLDQLPLDKETSKDMHKAFIAAYSNPQQKQTMEVYKDVHQKAQLESPKLAKELKALHILLKLFKQQQ